MTNHRTDLTTGVLEAIQTDTSTVCISAVQYATGSAVDVHEIVRRAHPSAQR